MSQNILTVVFGRKGTGKTSLTVSLVDQEVRKRARVVVLDPVGEYPGGVRLAPTDPDLDFYLRNERFNLRLHPVRPADLPVVFPKFLRIGNLLVILDEAQLFQDSNNLPPEFVDFITLGRRPGVDQVFVTQRPTMLHKDITSALDRAYIFQTREPRDLAYFATYISADVATKSAQLDRFEYLEYVVPNTYRIGKTQKFR